MPNQNPFLLVPGEANRTGENTSAQQSDMFMGSDKMVELLLATQPYDLDPEVRPVASSIEEELAWIHSLENGTAVSTEQCRRGIRLAYYAGHLFKNSDQNVCDQDDLMGELVGVITSTTPTTTLQRILITCEMPLLALGLQPGRSHRHAEMQRIINKLSSICEEKFELNL